MKRVSRESRSREANAGFSICLSKQDLIEENARDRFAQDGDEFEHEPEGYMMASLEAGFIDENGNITEKGWETLIGDMVTLEENAMKWLRRKFHSASDHGHDSFDDLVGAFYFDPENAEHADLVYTGYNNERIDFIDCTYSDLPNSIWRGVSDFGARLLDGQIYFHHVDKDVHERVTNRRDAYERQWRKQREAREGRLPFKAWVQMAAAL